MSKETRQKVGYAVTFSAAVCGFCGILSALNGIEFGTYAVGEGLVRAVLSGGAMCFFGYVADEMDKRMKREKRNRGIRPTAYFIRLSATAEAEPPKKPIRKIVF